MDHKNEIIPLDSLLLDVENARHGDLDDQNAVLKWMVSGKDREKVMNLAQSIAEHGFIPIELPLVMPAGDSRQQLYIVVEGNRRIAALKMLRDPDKAPDERAKKKFRDFKKKLQESLPSQLECIVFTDLQAAAPLIKLRHLGEQGGRGIVPWGAKESEYFAKRIGETGRYEPGMQLLDYATEKGLISQEESNRIPITNVTRLINSPYVRGAIGMNLSQGAIKRISDQDYFDKSVRDVFHALSSGEWTVSKLKHLVDREKFIDHIKMKQGWGSYEVRDEVPIISSAAQAGAERGEEKPEEKIKKRSSRDSLLRKYPIASNVSMIIQNKRLLTIFRELKTIDVDRFVNAASVLTRVFIEGCIDLYLKKNKIQINKKHENLAGKGRAVRKHIISSNGENEKVKNDLKGLEIFYSEPSGIGSANTFNAVVHNPQFSLTPEELKRIWDRLEPCLPWFEEHV
ncbi:MAG TPA: hypothetical protein VEF33_02095 [Syntrophales bacterium]|nr:hypothetical protein [Syntrophales bacterium]